MSAPTAAPLSAEILLGPFLRPRGVALLAHPDEAPADLLRRAAALRSWGYRGRVVAVDPRPHRLRQPGVDAAAHLAEAAPGCEVALLAGPARGLRSQLEECVAAGVMSAVALGSSARRAEVTAFLEANPSFRLVGPNCAGVLSAATGTILSTSSALFSQPPTRGGAALVTQSGGIGAALLLALQRRGAGFSHFVSTGDELGLGAVEVARELLDAPETTAVALFLEGLTDAWRLPRLREAAERAGKPAVALRGGSSPGARRAAFGHTGRIVGSDALGRAALEQAGVRLVASVEELCDVMTALSVLPIPTRSRRHPMRVGVVTPVGGSGVVLAEEIAREGLELAELGPDQALAIASATGTPGPAGNPYDVPSLGDRAVFGRALRALGRHGDCDLLLAVATTLAHDYEDLSSGDYSGLPPVIFAHLTPEDAFSAEQARRLVEAGVPSIPSLAGAVRAAAAWWDAPRPSGGLRPATPARPHLGLLRSRELVGGSLDRWVAPARAAASPEEARELAAATGGRVAVKAEGSGVEHRAEAGAVRLDLAPPEVADAYREVAAAARGHGDTVVVQPMAPPGLELLVSVVRDPELGPVAVVALGGGGAELAARAGVRPAILTGPRSRWTDLLERSSVGEALRGHRSRRPADTAGLLDLVDALLAAAACEERLAGIECNPAIVHPAQRPAGSRAVTVVDLLAYLAEEEA